MTRGNAAEALRAAGMAMVALVAALLLAACGSSGGGTSATSSDSSSATTSTTSTTDDEPIGLRKAAEEIPAIERDWGVRGYRRLVLGTLRLLDVYWHNKLPSMDGDYSPPGILRSYWTPAQDPDCGGSPLGMNNAAYCSDNNSISWDGGWLQNNFYAHVGDAAVSFVLAHEFGHLIQDRLGTFGTYEHQIEEELNADCLAGAWFGDVNVQFFRLTRADYRSLYDGVFDVSDPRGLPWQNPEAHGNARTRSFALDYGAKHGPEACMKKLHPGFLGK